MSSPVLRPVRPAALTGALTACGGQCGQAQGNEVCGCDPSVVVAAAAQAGAGLGGRYTLQQWAQWLQRLLLTFLETRRPLHPHETPADAVRAWLCGPPLVPGPRALAHGLWNVAMVLAGPAVSAAVDVLLLSRCSGPDAALRAQLWLVPPPPPGAAVFARLL